MFIRTFDVGRPTCPSENNAYDLYKCFKIHLQAHGKAHLTDISLLPAKRLLKKQGKQMRNSDPSREALDLARHASTIQTNVFPSLKIAVIDTVTFIKQSSGELITLTVLIFSFLKQKKPFVYGSGTFLCLLFYKPQDAL